MIKKVYIILLTLFCVSVFLATLFSIVFTMTSVYVWLRLAISGIILSGVSGFLIKLLPGE